MKTPEDAENELLRQHVHDLSAQVYPEGNLRPPRHLEYLKALDRKDLLEFIRLSELIIIGQGIETPIWPPFLPAHLKARRQSVQALEPVE